MNPAIDFSKLPLHDIHLPVPITWWPPAPAWWLVAALVLAGVFLLGVRYYRRRTRRVALASFRRLAAALHGGAEPVGCLQQLSTVLRRFAMSAAGDRATVAGLTGERWLAFLDSRWQRDAFSRGPGRILIAAPYAPPDTVERERALALTAICADWVKAQRPGG